MFSKPHVVWRTAGDFDFTALADRFCVNCIRSAHKTRLWPRCYIYESGKPDSLSQKNPDKFIKD